MAFLAFAVYMDRQPDHGDLSMSMIKGPSTMEVALRMVPVDEQTWQHSRMINLLGVQLICLRASNENCDTAGICIFWPPGSCCQWSVDALSEAAQYPLLFAQGRDLLSPCGCIQSRTDD